ncbi:MAG: glutaredoxin 3 [Lysobacterales bacterium]|jgi:glutaredoxin 3
MPNIEIYYKSWCPYSQRALQLLNAKGVEYTAIDLTDGNYDLELEMRKRSGRTSVPQIFVDNRHLGGYDDIDALDRVGLLDPLLFGKEVSRAA